MNPVADLIYQQVKTLPPWNAREVLNFVEYLSRKRPPQVSVSRTNADLLEFLDELPVGCRTAADIDKEFQALRDEWGAL